MALALAGWSLGQLRAAEEIVHTVLFPKGDAAWTVAFQAEKSAATPRPTPSIPAASPTPPPRLKQKIDIVRQGSLRHDIVHWSNGGSTELWWTEQTGFVLYQNTPYERVNILKTGNLKDERFDESLFTWVAAGTFVDMVSFQGAKCRHYKTEIASPSGEKQEYRIWIDNETQKPKAWSDSRMLVSFTFDNPMPAEPLILPEKFQKAIERVQSFSVFSKKNTTK